MRLSFGLLGLLGLFAATPCAAQQGGGGSGVPCSQASFLLSQGCAIDWSTSSQAHTDITAPLALDVNGGIGPIEVLQTAPSGGNITATDAGSTTTTGSGGQVIVTGTPTTGSTVPFIFPNAEGIINFNVTGLTNLGALTATAGGTISTGSATITLAANCPANVTSVNPLTVVDTSLSPAVVIGTVSSCPTSGTTLTLTANSLYAGSSGGSSTSDVLEFTGGGLISECSNDQVRWALCPVSIGGQNDVYTITGNVQGGRVVASGFRYWRLRNTASMSGTGTVAAFLSPIGNLPNYPQMLGPGAIPASLQGDGTNIYATPAMASVAGTPVTWTPTTPVNTVLTIANPSGMQSATLNFNSSSCTGPSGQIQAQISYGYNSSNALVFSNAVATQTRTTGGGEAANPYVLLNATNTPILIDMRGAVALQLKLTVALAGTGTCSVTISAALFPYLALPEGIANGAVAPGGSGGIGISTYALTLPTSQYPITTINGGTAPLQASGTGTTAATSATLAATASAFTFLCGFDIGADATAATEGNLTVVSNSVTIFTMRQSVAALANGTAHTTMTFSPCIPGNAVNKSIVITSAAAGSGGNTTVNAWGYANAQ